MTGFNGGKGRKGVQGDRALTGAKGDKGVRGSTVSYNE